MNSKQKSSTHKIRKTIIANEISTALDQISKKKVPEIAVKKVGVPNQNPTEFQSRNLSEARRKLAQAVDSGALDVSLIPIILDEEGFLPIEGSLIDYKRDNPANKGEQFKLLKHIHAFHNTYGGYLIIGAEEIEKDRLIEPVYKTLTHLDSKAIRDLCREYGSTPIELQCKTLTIEFKNSNWEIQVIQIPKRENPEPTHFKRDGIYEGKKIFAKDQILFRDGDNTISAATTQNHWRFLYGPRPNPFKSLESVTGPAKLLENNLPDKSLICPNFIGRTDTISELYQWLSDDFSCVRVIAGEGGLGKTSIAFEFAYEVAREHLVKTEIVLWFTAKKFQFRALDNQFEDTSYASFSNSSELFRVMASELGATPSELSDIYDDQLPKFLKSLIKEISAFIVIDDIDSLEVDEQKRCIEVCQQLAGSGSRFLFTTRKNSTASSSTSIEIVGLGKDDYIKLIRSWELRLKLAETPLKQIERLRDASQGSPLYTESLLRLIKSGIPINDAIAKWKGNLGVEVRNAALKREVLQLSSEAKKILTTAAIFGECSFAEIKEATGFSDMTLTDCVSELHSLFLISAPSIADQPRFKISNTTRELVLSLGPELTPAFSSYSEQIRSKRYKPKNANANSQTVGAAVNQAMALIFSNNPGEALKTVDEVNSKFGGKHPDLLFMRGRVLNKFKPARQTDARKAFKLAYDYGQRKLKFFELWYETEAQSTHFETAIEVATYAIESGSGRKADWLMNRAHSRVSSAGIQYKREDWEHVRTQLTLAAKDLFLAREDQQDLTWDNIWKENLFETHDSLWRLERKFSDSIPNLLSSLDSQISAIERGDHRYEVYLRLPMILKDMQTAIVKSDSEMTAREFNLMLQSTKKCKSAFDKAPNNLRTLSYFDSASKTIIHFSKIYRS
jgi:hypothetical protein